MSAALPLEHGLRAPAPFGRVVVIEPMSFATPRAELGGDAGFVELGAGEVLDVVEPMPFQATRFRGEHRPTWSANLFVEWEGATRCIPQRCVRPDEENLPTQARALTIELARGKQPPPPVKDCLCLGCRTYRAGGTSR